ncbi:MAG: hypothetical protein P3C12_07470 [Gemmatimonadota bacterium]|nr:hypothetical protein [Gemmatimonadota bacterium]
MMMASELAKVTAHASFQRAPGPASSCELYLRRGALSDNEIIARQQALATNYRFFVQLGMSYTFGSIFNTVVNPRFNGRGGQQF